MNEEKRIKGNELNSEIVKTKIALKMLGNLRENFNGLNKIEINQIKINFNLNKVLILRRSSGEEIFRLLKKNIVVALKTTEIEGEKLFKKLDDEYRNL